jgi:signal transduction histidine kinase
MTSEDSFLRLPASALERFTSLLISNPPLGLLLEETLAGLAGVLDLQAMALFVFHGDELRPVAAAQCQHLEILSLLPYQGRSDWWSSLEAGVVLSFAVGATGTPHGFEALGGSGLALLPLAGTHGLVRGVLAVTRQLHSGFVVAEQHVLTAMTRVIAVCVDRQLAPLPAGNAEIVALSGLMRLLESVPSESHLRRSALETLRPHLAGVSLCFAEFKAERLEILEFNGHEGLAQELIGSNQPDDAVLLEAVLSGSTAFFDSLPVDEGRFSKVGVTALSILPLPNGMALLALRRAQAGRWSEAERRLLGASGRMIGAALERLRVAEALFDARVRAELLAGLSDALQTAQTADEVAHIAMRLLAPSLRAANIFSLRVVREPQQIMVRGMGAWGHVPAAYGNHFSAPGLPLEKTTMTRVVVEQNRAHYEDYYVRRQTGEPVALGIEPVRNLAGEVIALISVGRDSSLGAWRSSEKELLARAAATVGLALERAEVREELLRAKQRAEVLSRLSDALQVAQTGEEVAEFAMKLLAPSLNAVNIITLKIETKSDGVYLRSMGVWGELPDLYDGYFRHPGVNIETTRISKQIYETNDPYYHTVYMDPDLKELAHRQVSIGLEPISDSRGAVLAILSVGRDPLAGAWMPSEMKLMAQAAATIGLALERAENRELLETRATALEEKSRALEAKSAEMETFVYSVSHDLKSPMVSMEGMSVLLEESLANKEYSELEFFVTRLRANVQTMTALVNGLLELSRVGRINESMDEVQVTKVIQTVLNELEGRIAEKQIQIKRPLEFPTVSYAPERLYQIFSNLIGNAVKFMNPNSQNILELGFKKKHQQLEFIIRDNGIGIAPHLRHKALELFSRLNPAVEGTGVGLAMVKRIVEHNGGYIRLEDTPGGGLTVIFTLPLERVLEFPGLSPILVGPPQ